MTGIYIIHIQYTHNGRSQAWMRKDEAWTWGQLSNSIKFQSYDNINKSSARGKIHTGGRKELLQGTRRQTDERVEDINKWTALADGPCPSRQG